MLKGKGGEKIGGGEKLFDKTWFESKLSIIDKIKGLFSVLLTITVANIQLYETMILMAIYKYSLCMVTNEIQIRKNEFVSRMEFW